jgi:hypothetical protein
MFPLCPRVLDCVPRVFRDVFYQMVIFLKEMFSQATHSATDLCRICRGASQISARVPIHVRLLHDWWGGEGNNTCRQCHTAVQK